MSVLEALARTLPHAINLRMLSVDEVHHLLAGGYRTAGGDDLIKYLANDLQRSVVIVGTSDAVVALQTDAQMSTRFTPMELPRWSESEDVSAWQFLRIGALVMPLALVAAFGAMLLQN